MGVPTPNPLLLLLLLLAAAALFTGLVALSRRLRGAYASFQYLTGDNSATVAMRYSYLPSWLSYLVDQKKARRRAASCSTRWMTAGPGCRPRTGRGWTCSA
jgi:hypothetical protein